MITTWLLRTLLVGLLLGVAALAAERVSGWMGRARRWVWVAAMVGSLAIPGLALWAPGIVPQIGVAAGWVERWVAGGEAVGSAPAIGVGGGVTAVALEPMVRAGGAGGEVSGTARESGRSVPVSDGSGAVTSISPSSQPVMGADPVVAGGSSGGVPVPVPVLIGFWILLSLAVVGVFVWGTVKLRLMRAESTPAVVDGVRVRLSRGLGPAVVGLVRPEVVIPRWVLGAPEEERKLILAHEREHIAARDSWLLAVGMLTLALMPWNPALWWQHRRLRLAVETDCDARVVANGASRRAYGEVLLRAASGTPVLSWLSPAWGESTTHLERRILAITARRSRYGKWFSVPLLMVALTVGLVACDIAQRGRVVASPVPEELGEDANPAAGQLEHIVIAAVPLPDESAAEVDASHLTTPDDPSRLVPEVYAISGSLPHAVPSEGPYFFTRPIPAAPADPPSQHAWVISQRPPPPIVVVDAELARHLEEISVHHAEAVRMHRALEEQHRLKDEDVQAWHVLLEEEHPRSPEQWQAVQRAEEAVLRTQQAVLATSANVLHASPATLRFEPGRLEVREVPIVDAVRPLPHGMISGVITDPEGRVIPNAPVTLQPLRRGTVTNAEGRFLLHDIPPGTYTLMGVRPNTGRMIRREVEVEGGDRQTIHIVF